MWPCQRITTPRPDRVSGRHKKARRTGLFCGKDQVLLDLGFLVYHMLANDGIILLDLHLFGHGALVFGRGVEVTGVSAGNQLDFFADTFGHGLSPYTFTPRARMSASTLSMPCLSMIRIPLVDTRSLTKRFSLSTQKRCFCRLGRKRRRVAFISSETLFPVTGPLLVTCQTLDIAISSNRE